MVCKNPELWDTGQVLPHFTSPGVPRHPFVNQIKKEDEQMGERAVCQLPLVGNEPRHADFGGKCTNHYTVVFDKKVHKVHPLQ